MICEYELIVYKKATSSEYGNVGVKIKRFIGDDVNTLKERFETWFIKQGYDREEILLRLYTRAGQVNMEEI